MQTGRGQDLDGSSRGLNTACMQPDRAQANQGVGKVNKLIPASLWDTPARKLGKVLLRMARRQNRVRDQVSHSRKQQTTGPHSVHWWLNHQRLVKMGLHCQARCDHHPWRQCSLYGLDLQSDNGGRSSQHTVTVAVRPHTPSSSQIQWACFKKAKSRIGSPDCMVRVNGQHPSFKTPPSVLPWTC